MSAAQALAGRLPAVARASRAAAAAGAGGALEPPLVAILCAPSRAHVAAAGVALALARAAGRSCALAGAVGFEEGAALPALPAAGRAATTLRRRGLPAGASGRLVWIADHRGPLTSDDVPARCAASSAELGRAAMALGTPAAVAFPCARTDALDRVLAWHDAIVVVREPDASGAVIEHALASLARLRRPVVAMAPPARVSGALAVAGLAVPPEAARAVAELADGRRP
ncbi:MAG: hypothetical protein ACTHOE_05935 [Conexibacter sp.]